MELAILVSSCGESHGFYIVCFTARVVICKDPVIPARHFTESATALLYATFGLFVKSYGCLLVSCSMEFALD